MYFFYLLTIINFLGVVYLIFLFYKKNETLGKKESIVTKESSVNNIKIDLTRYNPFNEMGGDQSFILTILDNTNSGVIITSLHNRDNTRIYAKKIKNGDVDNSALSKEEKSAIVKTIKG